jgi:hypothetical protein
MLIEIDSIAIDVENKHCFYLSFTLKRSNTNILLTYKSKLCLFGRKNCNQLFIPHNNTKVLLQN